MAGDWIKMRVGLADEPEVIGMAADLGLEEDVIVGKLHRLWSWADQHTVDGKTGGVTPVWIDRYVACQGFSEVMIRWHWLVATDSGIELPNFERHNGESAKKRVAATARQRLSRQERDKSVTGVTRVVTPRPFVRKVIERDGGKCAYCETTGHRTNPLGVDHVIPLSRGGKDAMENLVTCCSRCNNEKNDRTPEEWGIDFDVTRLSQDKCDKGVTDVARERDTSATREEKRRVTNTDRPNGLSCSTSPIRKQPCTSKQAEAIYEAYPRHVGKAKALTAISKALRIIAERQPLPRDQCIPDERQSVEDPVAWLLERVETFAQSPAGKQGQYTCHPATWFNQGRYDDDDSEWQRTDERGPTAPKRPDRASDDFYRE